MHTVLLSIQSFFVCLHVKLAARVVLCIYFYHMHRPYGTMLHSAAWKTVQNNQYQSVFWRFIRNSQQWKIKTTKSNIVHRKKQTVSYGFESHVNSKNTFCKKNYLTQLTLNNSIPSSFCYFTVGFIIIINLFYEHLHVIVRFTV